MDRELVTLDWLHLEAKVYQNGKTSHLSMAMTLLHDILVRLYGEPRVFKLQQVRPDIPWLCSLTRVCNEIIAQDRRHWKRATTHKILSTLRKIVQLQITGVRSGIVRAIRLLPIKIEWNRALARKHATLPPDHPTRVLLESWLNRLRQITCNRSNTSLKNIMSFWLQSVLPACDLKLETWPHDKDKHNDNNNDKDNDKDSDIVKVHVRKLCESKESLRALCKRFSHLHWLQLFAENITGAITQPISWPTGLAQQLRRNSHNGNNGSNNTSLDQDPCASGTTHLIKTEHLERLYEASQAHESDEMMFLALLSTGMRCGAYTNIKCVRVADLVEGRWRVRNEGETCEKGSKHFAFKIMPRLQELMTIWLNKRRAFDEQNPYLVPGKYGGRMSTYSLRRRFAGMCRRANLHGPQFHPHSLRHCYVKMLLALGNPIEVVSKLINHSNVLTTQKYYVHETAADLAERAAIPWLAPHKPELLDPIPNFLKQHNDPRRLELAKLQHLKSTLLC